MRFVPVLILLAAAGAVEAQQQRGPRPAGRVAGIAPAPSAPAEVTHRRGGHGSGVVVRSRVPVVVLSDGRVFANFGFGFEQVIRSCGSFAAGPAIVQHGVRSPTLTRVIQPSVPRIVAPAPPTFTQPVPAQPTASQQMLGIGLGTGGTPAVPHRGRASCFTRDAFGQVIVH